jgi:cytochrome c5
VGDNQDWGVRLEQGFDTLLTHALAGFNLMPARGGNPNLKDPEIEAALLHMLAESGLEVPGRVAETAPPAPAIQSETVVTPAEDEAKANTAPESQVETDLAVAPEATTTETIPEQNIPQAAVKESEPVVVPIISSDVYKKECASCHDAGTDNAPRIGVQEAWIASIAMGIDVLARDTAKGPPAHPDIRNRKLSNDQITNAIEYIMQQTFWPVSK